MVDIATNYSIYIIYSVLITNQLVTGPVSELCPEDLLARSAM